MGVFKPYRFYTKEQIEGKANNVLRQMEADNFTPEWPLDATYVADALELRVDIASIPPDEKGFIAAKIEPLERRITLNKDVSEILDCEGFKQSTIAHEIGHWILHINHDEADGIVKQLELNLNLENANQFFLCRNSENDKIITSSLKHQIDKIEWQAQYFASCLLMPRYKLEELRKGRDLAKWRHLYAMKDELGVTISNLTNRLKDLGWIYIPKGSKQIYLKKESKYKQIDLL